MSICITITQTPPYNTHITRIKHVRSHQIGDRPPVTSTDQWCVSADGKRDSFCHVEHVDITKIDNIYIYIYLNWSPSNAMRILRKIAPRCCEMGWNDPPVRVRTLQHILAMPRCTPRGRITTMRNQRYHCKKGDPSHVEATYIYKA